ncbi:ATP synthase subunit delta [Sarcoptes scabiei]|nr:ATP synthase subunit delta [Sarcoptes scabiei]
MDPDDNRDRSRSPNQDLKSPSSPPSSTEISMALGYISSYTQISQPNQDDQTDIDSSDEDANELDPIKKQTESILIPKLSSEIVEWSKKTFESLHRNEFNDRNDADRSKILDDPSSNDSIIERLKFFSPEILNDLEMETMMISNNIQDIVHQIKSFSSDATLKSVDIMKLFQESVFDVCDGVDTNIKLAFELNANIENANELYENRATDSDNRFRSQLDDSISGNISPSSMLPRSINVTDPAGNDIDEVYIWDCCRSLFISDKRSINKIIMNSIFICNVILQLAALFWASEYG